MLPSFLNSQLVLIASSVSLILTFVAIAEAIRLGMDIQNNTHAAAQFIEQTARVGWWGGGKGENGGETGGGVVQSSSRGLDGRG